MPNFHSALQVRCDHRCTRAQAVWAACVFDHVFWKKEKIPGGENERVCFRSFAFLNQGARWFESEQTPGSKIGYECFKMYDYLIFHHVSSARPWLTAERTGVEADEIFMAPPAAGVSMTFKQKKRQGALGMFTQREKN